MPTFLDAEAFIDHLDMTMNLWKCANVDTLAAIAGPMAYAYYKKMPDALVYQAQKKLPEWMVDVSERFDFPIRSITYLFYDLWPCVYFLRDT